MFIRFSPMKFVAAVLLIAIPATVRAQTLAERLPPDTSVYFGWQGVESLGAGFAGSNLNAVLADSRIPEMVNDFVPKLLDRLAGEDPGSAQEISLLRSIGGPLWKHPSALAFVGVELDAQNVPRPKLILLCQAGKDAASLKATAIDTLKQAGQTPFPVDVIQKDDLVALVVGYDHPESALVAAGEKSLATNAEFTKALAQVGKAPFATAYVDVQKLLDQADMIAGLIGDEGKKRWEQVRDTLGLKSIERVVATQGFDGKEWSTQAFVASPGPRTGVVGSMLNSKALSDEIIAAIPENCTMAGAGHFDIGAVITSIRGGIASVDPDTGQKIDDAVNQINQAAGFDVQKDLLDNFGNGWAYYVNPAIAGDGAVGTTIVNRLKEPAKTEADLLKCQQFIDKAIARQINSPKMVVAFRSGTVDGVNLHYFGTPLLTPAWTISDGNLYVGLYPEVVAAAAKQVSGKGKSITANPAFATVFKRLGDHPVSSFGFIDLARRVPENYGSWLVISHLADAGDLVDVPAPLQILPPLEKLLANLSASGQISWTDADGFHASALSPFPGAEVLASDVSSMSVAEASMMVSVLLPALNKAREAALHVKSSSNLQQIGLGAFQYATKHDGNYPHDLGEIFEEVGGTPSVFVSPNSDRQMPANLTPGQAKKWVVDNSDYVWVGSEKTPKNASEKPIAWENPAGPKANAGINILFADGHVEFQTMSEAMKIIEPTPSK